jgi:hypothetical protein
MRKIRRFLYDIGMRPSKNAVFFSPSLAMTTSMQSWTEAFEKGGDMRYAGRHSSAATTAVIQLPTVSVEIDRKASMFERFAFCPMCGSKLGVTLQGSKICQQMHGQTSLDMIEDEDETLPTVTFELYE